MLNALTIDVEDYYHVSAFEAVVPFADWERYESRVEKNTHRILDLLDAHTTKATFFVLGWVVERHPGLIRTLVTRGQPIRGYRAASYSITVQSLWALDVLREEGFVYDSSIFPIRHDLYGIPSHPRFCYMIPGQSDSPLVEFPLSTLRLGGTNFPIAGGGYLRLFPYAYTRWGIRYLNRREDQPAVVYLHPWELDPEQPRLPAGKLSRFRHYTNLHRMEERFVRLLQDFSFGTMSEVLQTRGLLGAVRHA